MHFPSWLIEMINGRDDFFMIVIQICFAGSIHKEIDGSVVFCMPVYWHLGSLLSFVALTGNSVPFRISWT